MDKIKAGLSAITEKYKKDVSSKLDRRGEPDTLPRNLELLAKSRNAHYDEIMNYPIKFIADLDSNEKQELENFTRTLLVDFDEFLKVVS
jgi:hypothetical protein